MVKEDVGSYFIRGNFGTSNEHPLTKANDLFKQIKLSPHSLQVCSNIRQLIWQVGCLYAYMNVQISIQTAGTVNRCEYCRLEDACSHISGVAIYMDTTGKR